MVYRLLLTAKLFVLSWSNETGVCSQLRNSYLNSAGSAFQPDNDVLARLPLGLDRGLKICYHLSSKGIESLTTWRFLWGVDEISTIILKGGSNGRLMVALPYSVERVARVKSTSGRRWHPKEKCWSVPNTEGMVEGLLTLFVGEQVEVDPARRPVRVPDNREPPLASGSTPVVRYGVPAPSRKGYRFRAKRNHGPQWQGGEGPPDDTSGVAQVAPSGPFMKGQGDP